jgi:hypothetical protein
MARRSGSPWDLRIIERLLQSVYGGDDISLMETSYLSFGKRTKGEEESWNQMAGYI